MANFDTSILNMNIEKEVSIIKNRALTNKQLLRNFLEGFIIEDNFSINDYITYHLLTTLENEQHKEYTYWLDTGITWLLWYQEKFGKLSDEEYKSLTTGYFKVRYVFNIKESYENKIKQLYFFTLELKNKINAKLSENVNFNFEAHIELKNISVENNVDENGILNYKFKYNYDTKTLFKEPTFNIRLVLKKKISGGARIKKYNFKKQQQYGVYKKLGNELEKILVEEFPIINDDFIKLNDDAFNNKIILDFNIEYYYTKLLNRHLDIEKFINAYIITEKVNKSYDMKPNKKLYNREKLNRLNEIGMMTYCLLNLSTVEDEFGLNVDKYRQQLFFKHKKVIPLFLEKLLNIYTIFFKNFKSYNVFFIDKINEIINKYKSPNFETFKDFIDRWFVSMFRPSINSFILEINKELQNKFNVRLFIAGGDAMRRYENDISFTKDIDTKLYINNVNITDPIILQEIENLKLKGFNEKIIIKDMVVGVIVKHIVKLRNFLEQNIKLIFKDILQYDSRDIDKGTSIFSFKTSDNHRFFVDILLDTTSKDKFQQFRTRENKKRGDFPVDLYSIDFRTFISEYDEFNNLIGGKKKAHDISLLDVVLQDVDNFYDRYLIDFEGIPIASLEFLLEDFHKTYITDDRALARISSGKVVKDISRFNKILELYNKQKSGQLIVDNGSILKINNIDEIIDYLEDLRYNFSDLNIFNQFYHLLNLIKNKQPISITDINLSKNIFNNVIIQEILSRFPEFKLVILNMILLNKNIYNEDLKKTENLNYNIYKTDNDNIRKGYYPLFSKLCSIENNDGMVRHVIMFSNSKIESLFKDNDITQNSKKYYIKKSDDIKQKPAKAVSSSVKTKTQPKPQSQPQPQPQPTIMGVSSRGRAIKINIPIEKKSRKTSQNKKDDPLQIQQIPNAPLSTILSVPEKSSTQRGLKRSASIQLQKK